MAHSERLPYLCHTESQRRATAPPRTEKRYVASTSHNFSNPPRNVSAALRNDRRIRAAIRRNVPHSGQRDGLRHGRARRRSQRRGLRRRRPSPRRCGRGGRTFRIQLPDESRDAARLDAGISQRDGQTRSGTHRLRHPPERGAVRRRRGRGDWIRRQETGELHGRHACHPAAGDREHGTHQRAEHHSTPNARLRDLRRYRQRFGSQQDSRHGAPRTKQFHRRRPDQRPALHPRRHGGGHLLRLRHALGRHRVDLGAQRRFGHLVLRFEGGQRRGGHHHPPYASRQAPSQLFGQFPGQHPRSVGLPAAQRTRKARIRTSGRRLRRFHGQQQHRRHQPEILLRKTRPGQRRRQHRLEANGAAHGIQPHP